MKTSRGLPLTYHVIDTFRREMPLTYHVIDTFRREMLDAGELELANLCALAVDGGASPAARLEALERIRAALEERGL